MNVKVYYQKLHSVEESIPGPHAVLVSLETPDGGRAGVMTEAPRRVAARLIVEGKARIASEEEAKAFQAEAAEVQRRAEEALMAERARLAAAVESAVRRPAEPGKGAKS